MAAVVAQLLKQRQRVREHTFKVRKVQSSWLATQPFHVLLAMANDGAKQARRVVPRALGKWRGSTLSGYLKHDDQTYLERFRATRAQLDGLVIRLQGSQLDSAENRLVREIARPPPSRHHHRAQLLARHLHGGAPARRKRAGLETRRLYDTKWLSACILLAMEVRSKF